MAIWRGLRDRHGEVSTLAPTDGVTSWRSTLRIATALLALRRPAEALQELARDFDEEPEDDEATLVALEARILLDDHAGAMRLVDGCADDTADWAILRACLAAQHQDPQTSEWIRTAQGCVDGGLRAPHRLRWLQHLQHQLAAREPVS